MLSKLLGSSVVVIGLLLAGPQRASADVVYACVNTTTGLLYVVSATTNCPPPSSGATWIKINWNATDRRWSGLQRSLYPERRVHTPPPSKYFSSVLYVSDPTTDGHYRAILQPRTVSRSQAPTIPPGTTFRAGIFIDRE